MVKYIMYNDDEAAASFEYHQGKISWYRPLVPELLPKQICKNSEEALASWIRDRAIDLNTVQHRNLVYHLLGSRDKIYLALLTNMFSISDTFTCFEEGTFIPRNHLCSTENQETVSNYILLSGDTSIQKAAFATPNVSTDGSFTKTWKYEKGQWWLYKLQSTEATKSEVEISRILLKCGWDAALYCYDGAYRKRVKSLNFVGEHEFFEPYDSFRFAFDNISDEDDVIFKNLASSGEHVSQAWKRILVTDALFLNGDRHMRNFGVIRSCKTGEVLRLAPNFDNNQAYKGNPGGKYSDGMLRYYWQMFDNEDKANLKQLLEACSDNKYLSEAWDAGTRLFHE